MSDYFFVLDAKTLEVIMSNGSFSLTLDPSIIELLKRTCAITSFYAEDCFDGSVKQLQTTLWGLQGTLKFTRLFDAEKRPRILMHFQTI